MSLKDSTKTIISSAKGFFSGTVISRSFGLIREILMAAAFGTAPQVAAFWMAYRFAHLLRRIFGEGGLNAAFIPHFENLRKEDPAKGARFFYDLSLGMTFLLLLIAFAIEVALGSCLIFCEWKESTKEVIRLTMLMLPALVFISLYALNTSLLNCERKYFLPSVAPAFLNVVWTIAVLFLWKWLPYKAMEMLALILVFAFCVQWFVTVPDVYRFLKKELGENWWQQKKFQAKEIAALLRPFFLAILGVTATQINSAMDAIFARISDPEGPAYLWYAIRIQQLPLALFGIGLTGALLPPISRAIQNQDAQKYQQFLVFALKQTILFMLPMTFGIFALGFSCINLIYGHGAFSNTAVIKTTTCLWAYGVGLVPMTTVLVLASAFFAKKNYRIPTFLSVGSVAFNVFLNTICVFIFHLNALSIAISTSATALLNLAFLGYFLKKENGPFLSGIRLFFGKVFFAGLFATLVTLSVGYFVFQDQTLFCLLGNANISISHNLKEQMISFCSLAALFIVSFALAAYACKIKEFLDFLPKRRFLKD